MSAPNPWKHRKSIVCLVAQATPATGMDNIGKPAHTPDDYHLYVQIVTYIHDSQDWGEEKPFEVTSLEDWKEPLKYIHDLGDLDPSLGGASLVSVHNKAVIQRAAWWWSRADAYGWSHLGVFSDTSRQEDVVDLYNGPAIVTAEERYSFSTRKACSNVGIEYEDNNEFKSLCNLWLRLTEH